MSADIAMGHVDFTNDSFFVPWGAPAARAGALDAGARVQCALDTFGLPFLFLGSAGAHPEIAAVTGSTFGAITTLLVRLVLHGRIGLIQGLGIVLVFVCVGMLAAQ